MMMIPTIITTITTTTNMILFTATTTTTRRIMHHHPYSSVLLYPSSSLRRLRTLSSSSSNSNSNSNHINHNHQNNNSTITSKPAALVAVVPPDDDLISTNSNSNSNNNHNNHNSTIHTKPAALVAVVPPDDLNNTNLLTTNLRRLRTLSSSTSSNSNSNSNNHSTVTTTKPTALVAVVPPDDLNSTNLNNTNLLTTNLTNISTNLTNLMTTTIPNHYNNTTKIGTTNLTDLITNLHLDHIQPFLKRTQLQLSSLRLSILKSIIPTLSLSDRQSLFSSLLPSSSHTAATNTANTANNDILQDIQTLLQSTTTTQHHTPPPSKSTTNTQDHPILGPPITSLGYKTIYQTSIQTLSTLSIYQKTQTYNRHRVQQILFHKIQSSNHSNDIIALPGIITLHEDIHGTLSIINGQHRIVMFAALLSQQERYYPHIWLPSLILVEVFPSSCNVQHLHHDLNPPSQHSSHYKGGKKLTQIQQEEHDNIQTLQTIIHDTLVRIQASYPRMFRHSTKCHMPHVHIPTLEIKIYEVNVIGRNNLEWKSDVLYDWLMERNEELKVKYSVESYVSSHNHGKSESEEEEEDNEEKIKEERRMNTLLRTPTKGALRKARGSGFYLGLDDTWLYV